MQISYKNMFYVINVFGWKSSRENVEYMTRIISLGGNPNRRQDIFKSCRGGTGPSEHANILQKHIMWSNVSDEKVRAKMSNMWPELFF